MGNPVRLYLDENVEIAIAEQLQRRGHDVVTVLSLNVLGDSDINHLTRATEMGRVLCTYDHDFARLSSQGAQHAGIVLGMANVTSIGDWVSFLDVLCQAMTANEMVNHIEYI